MAKLSGNGKYVTVQKGDTLSEIARDYGNGKTYQQLASINGIKNPNYIVVGQIIYLVETTTTAIKPANDMYAVITAFGLQSNTDRTVYGTWTWKKKNTKEYQVRWHYDTGDGVWFIGNNKITVTDNQYIFNAPNNAKRVRIMVRPVSTTRKVNGKDTNYWNGLWGDWKVFSFDPAKPETPPVPTVKIETLKLTAEVNNIDSSISFVQFEVVKNDVTTMKTAKVKVTTGSSAYSVLILAGGRYKVRCRSHSNGLYSEWSEYSSNIGTSPATPGKLTKCQASTDTSILLEWAKVENATSYDIEYTTKKSYFDGSDQTTVISNIETTQYEKTGLTSGTEYFFRIRANNDRGKSGWSEISSTIIGKGPAAPTTWSSTTTAVTGEDVNLYWVHNTEDGSSQTFAELEIYINGVKETHTIENTTKEDEKDKTSTYLIKTSSYVEGTQIQWRVRTAGISKVYGEWSIQRTIDIYAPPTLELNITDSNGETFDSLISFPFYISALAGPNTQQPIGYHVSIESNDIYETTDNVGNVKMVNSGETVYSKYFDTSDPLLVEMSASNIDLENNISYTVRVTVSMNSGLTAEESSEFTVLWEEMSYIPNAEISLDKDSFSANIRPYCSYRPIVYYKVNLSSGVYVKTNETISALEGDRIEDVTTTTGEKVFTGTASDGSTVYFCFIESEEDVLIEDVVLSVYRREFDGEFTEIIKDIDNLDKAFVTDPHPALDYARYRIVAKSKTTGAIGFCDIPDYPVGGDAVIIQWDEQWSNYVVSDDEVLEQPPWSGSLLRLPYNIDITSNYKTDTALVEYIGRKHPVGYYGTQLGETATWSMVIEKDDVETIYGLRRLATWAGNVYIREPSGSGYWASVTVSFSQQHLKVVVPVTLTVTRVEGGI